MESQQSSDDQSAMATGDPVAPLTDRRQRSTPAIFIAFSGHATLHPLNNQTNKNKQQEGASWPPFH